MEKNHKDDLSREDTIKLTVKSLLEVVQTGAKNIEISVMESYGKVTSLALSEIEAIVAEIEKEKEAGSSFGLFFCTTLTDIVLRGREEAFEIGSDSCWSSGDVPTRSRSWFVVVINSEIDVLQYVSKRQQPCTLSCNNILRKLDICSAAGDSKRSS